MRTRARPARREHSANDAAALATQRRQGRRGDRWVSPRGCAGIQSRPADRRGRPACARGHSALRRGGPGTSRGADLRSARVRRFHAARAALRALSDARHGLAQHALVRHPGLAVRLSSLSAARGRRAAATRACRPAHGVRHRDHRAAALEAPAAALARYGRHVSIRRRIAFPALPRQCTHGRTADAPDSGNAPAVAAHPVAQAAMSSGGAVVQASWATARERGALFMMRLMVAALKLLWRPATVPFAHLATLYFFTFGRRARAISRDYLQRVARRYPESGLRPDAWCVYRHFSAFTYAILDKLDAWSGRLDYGKVTFEGHDALAAAATSGRGVLVIGSHLGNLEVCRALASLNRRVRLNV